MGRSISHNFGCFDNRGNARRIGESWKVNECEICRCTETGRIECTNECTEPENDQFPIPNFQNVEPEFKDTKFCPKKLKKLVFDIVSRIAEILVNSRVQMEY